MEMEELFGGLGGVAFLTAIGGLLIIPFIIAIVAYILMGIGLYKTAQANGENAILAWFPITREYLIGKLLGDKMDVFGWFTIPMLSVVFPIVTYGSGLVSTILGIIPVIGAIITFVLPIAIMVFNFLIWMNYAKAMGKNDVGSYILYYLFGFIMVFLSRGTVIGSKNID